MLFEESLSFIPSISAMFLLQTCFCSQQQDDVPFPFSIIVKYYSLVNMYALKYTYCQKAIKRYALTFYSLYNYTRQQANIKNYMISNPFNERTFSGSSVSTSNVSGYGRSHRQYFNYGYGPVYHQPEKPKFLIKGMVNQSSQFQMITAQNNNKFSTSRVTTERKFMRNVQNPFLKGNLLQSSSLGISNGSYNLEQDYVKPSNRYEQYYVQPSSYTIYTDEQNKNNKYDRKNYENTYQKQKFTKEDNSSRGFSKEKEGLKHAESLKQMNQGKFRRQQSKQWQKERPSNENTLRRQWQNTNSKQREQNDGDSRLHNFKQKIKDFVNDPLRQHKQKNSNMSNYKQNDRNQSQYKGNQNNAASGWQNSYKNQPQKYGRQEKNKQNQYEQPKPYQKKQSTHNENQVEDKRQSALNKSYDDIVLDDEQEAFDQQPSRIFKHNNKKDQPKQNQNNPESNVEKHIFRQKSKEISNQWQGQTGKYSESNKKLQNVKKVDSYKFSQVRPRISQKPEQQEDDPLNYNYPSFNNKNMLKKQSIQKQQSRERSPTFNSKQIKQNEGSKKSSLEDSKGIYTNYHKLESLQNKNFQTGDFGYSSGKFGSQGKKSLERQNDQVGNYMKKKSSGGGLNYSNEDWKKADNFNSGYNQKKPESGRNMKSGHNYPDTIRLKGITFYRCHVGEIQSNETKGYSNLGRQNEMQMEPYGRSTGYERQRGQDKYRSWGDYSNYQQNKQSGYSDQYQKEQTVQYYY